MTNLFFQEHLDCIVAALSAANVPSDVKVLRSKFYSRAIVIGRKDLPGCILLSQSNEDTGDGKFPWIVNYFPRHQPKEVSDGEINLIVAYSDRFDYFQQLLDFIIRLASNGFSESVYLQI